MADNIVEALFNVQSKLLKPEKGAVNPHFGSKYVSLDSLLEVVLPAFNEEGILLMQSLTDIEGKPALQTSFILADTGNSVEHRTPMVFTKEDPQAVGSAITYYRRYSLMSALGLVGEEDDDGNAASAPKPTRRTRAKVKPSPDTSAKTEAVAPGADDPGSPFDNNLF